MKIPVAVVIPTFNRKRLLENCVRLLTEQTVKPELIIVVNDGSKDGTDEILRTEFPEVIQLMGDGNLWWTESVNTGIRYVLDNHPTIQGVIMQNDDVEFDRDWIEKLMEVVDQNPHSLIGCINVDINNPDVITYAGKTTHPWFAYSKYYNRGRHLSDFPADTLAKSFDLIGRGIYIPREVFEKLGVYDSKHFKMCGDTELPLRAKYAGYNLYVTYKAVVKEYTEETSGVDIKKTYTLKDFKKKFFDFRSSAYWQYRFYYGKIVAKNPIQHACFFTCRMIVHFGGFVSRLRLW